MTADSKPKRNGNAPRYDWEAIERDYVAGQISIREIARQHGCNDAAIHRKARRLGWERDLSAVVRKTVRSKLARSGVSSARVSKRKVSDKEIIEQAAERGAQVVSLQRKDIASLRELEEQLIAELKDGPKKLYITQYQGEIVSKEVSLTVAERAQAANNLANVQHKRIALERQAYNLDDDLGQVVKDIVSKLTPDSRKLLAQAFEGNDDAECGD
jgi:transposase-like protein